MKLIFCLNIYNEIQFLEQCLESIKDQADRIIVVDGAYSNFPHENPSSTDGSLDIVGRYTDELITTDKAWPSQIVKRNQYLLGEEGDYYFVIDGDEELRGEVKGLIKEDDWNITLDRTDDIAPYDIYRVSKHRNGIHYEGTHHCLMIDGEILNKRDIKTLDGCSLMHYHPDRNQERIMQKGHYYRSRTEEFAFRAANKM